MPKREMITLKLGAYSFITGVKLQYEWVTTIESILIFPHEEIDEEIQKFFTGYLGVNRPHSLTVPIVAFKLVSLIANHYEKEVLPSATTLTQFRLCGAEWSQEFIFYVE